MNLLRNRNNVTTYSENKNVYRNLYVSIQNEKIVINAPWYTKIKVLGNNYELSIKYKVVSAPNLSIEENKIIVTLPNKYKKMQNNQLIEMLINKMYNMVSRKEVERAMEEVRIAMQIAPEDYEIKTMDGVLAKCNNKKITINPNIAMYSREVIKYIVVHEFCHLKYKNHTKSFYDMVATYIPNYEEYANEVNKLKY